MYLGHTENFEVDLFTRNREFIITVYIPEYMNLPEVIMWGSRTFHKDTDGVYTEVTSFTVMHTKDF